MQTLVFLNGSELWAPILKVICMVSSWLYTDSESGAHTNWGRIGSTFDYRRL